MDTTATFLWNSVHLLLWTLAGVKRKSVLHLCTLANAALSTSVVVICVGNVPHSSHLLSILAQHYKGCPAHPGNRANLQSPARPLSDLATALSASHMNGRRTFFSAITSVLTLRGSGIQNLLNICPVQAFNLTRAWAESLTRQNASISC